MNESKVKFLVEVKLELYKRYGEGDRNEMGGEKLFEYKFG